MRRLAPALCLLLCGAAAAAPPACPTARAQDEVALAHQLTCFEAAERARLDAIVSSLHLLAQVDPAELSVAVAAETTLLGLLAKAPSEVLTGASFEAALAACDQILIRSFDRHRALLALNLSPAAEAALRPPRLPPAAHDPRPLDLRADALFTTPLGEQAAITASELAFRLREMVSLLAAYEGADHARADARSVAAARLLNADARRRADAWAAERQAALAQAWQARRAWLVQGLSAP